MKKDTEKTCMKKYLYPARICLPDFLKVNGSKWASVACDQYTSQKEYWEEAYSYVGGEPSTLDLMLPEAFLDREEEMIPRINGNMKKYADEILFERENTIVYLERVQSDGRVRRGLIGCVDLEDYEYTKGSETLIRATEGTVLERIPPRVAIRRGAVLEMPHIMILIDDPDRTVIEPIAAKSEGYETAYDFDLMAGGGHVKGYFVDEKDFDGINVALDALATTEAMKEKYNVDAPALLFAMGDGNHSLASAKALYEEIKAEIGNEAALTHPARYALCEIVNLHDGALDFEPIYRAVFGVEPESFISELEAYVALLDGEADEQKIEVVWGENERIICVGNPTAQLAVGTVQNFLDKYVKEHKGAEVDYIHGVEVTKSLAQKENTVGILFDGMTKDMLFKTVICDGALPRKTFSMGHAADKRFYLECRKIR
jgi:hypothetical protein